MTAGLGAAGVRGLVVVRGPFDLEAADRFVEAVERVLSADVGELWIDLRAVELIATIAAAALRRCRRRAARLHVGVRLLVGGGPVLQVLRSTGLADAVAPGADLPADLAAPDRRLGAPMDAGGGERNWRRRAPAPVQDAEIPVLAVDPDLGRGLPEPALRAATRALVAPVVTLQPGRWRGGLAHLVAPGDLGLLIVEGVLVRRVGHAHGFGAEILGPGDLVRIGDRNHEDTTPWFETSVRVVAPVRAAMLDERFTLRAGAFPAVVANLADRAMAQSHALMASMAVAHYPRVERRVLLVLWQLAQRWGRVTPHGIVLRLPLTHSILADLTASRRPSVTLALQRLEETGALERRDGEWLLRGASPATASDAPGPPAPQA